MKLSEVVTSLKGVGPRVAERLAALEIRTVQDLLFHLPRRYEDRTRVTPIGGLRPGQQAVIDAQVELADVKYGRRRSLLVRVSDGTGFLTVRLFHFSTSQKNAFARGKRFRFFGEVRYGSAAYEMVHPEYTPLFPGEEIALEDRLTPIYPATEGVSQLLLRRYSEQALQCMGVNSLIELIPETLHKNGAFSALSEAIQFVHRPPIGESAAELEAGNHPAQQRLAFEELLAHHLSLKAVRNRAREKIAPVFSADCTLCVDFEASLAFELTGAQKKVAGEIAVDLNQKHPMMRLVQGDVGSGKTVVAALAALQAVASGYQVAVMAPTELLAEQHFLNFQNWLEPLNLNVGWLSGKIKGKARKSSLLNLSKGVSQVVVGTHALFQEEVVFKRLGLIIIDEQHRFGVHQRLALRDKSVDKQLVPHQLIMTATPIPRTLAMTFYADLDHSIIDELPPGRIPVQTVAVVESRRDEIIVRVKLACANGSQTYWVCALIEQSDMLQCQAAEDVSVMLSQVLPELTVGLVHGRMKAKEKTAVMMDFKAGKIDLLVATTVIEVGVDVPNATLMIIENAERLGLAQLHQLRGRVGRGSDQSSCVLMYQGPLSAIARKRLGVMRNTNDGFEVAQEDLELRGPGEVLGTRQTGDIQFRIADLVRDSRMLDDVERVADCLIADYPEHVAPLIQRWLGSADRYGHV